MNEWMNECNDEHGTFCCRWWWDFNYGRGTLLVDLSCATSIYCFVFELLLHVYFNKSTSQWLVQPCTCTTMQSCGWNWWWSKHLQNELAAFLFDRSVFRITVWQRHILLWSNPHQQSNESIDVSVTDFSVMTVHHSSQMIQHSECVGWCLRETFY